MDTYSEDSGKTVRWHLAERDDDPNDKCHSRLAKALTAHFDAVDRQQQQRNDAYKRNLKLYQGRSNLPGKSEALVVSPTGQVLSLNVIASILRSLRAKIVKNRVAPWVLTDSGTQAQQLAADQCQQFLMGAIYECNVYQAMARGFDLAGICGSVDAKVYPDFDAKRIRVEICYPWEVPIDDQDAYYGNPRARYQKSYVDKDVALELYGGEGVPEEVRNAILLTENSKGDPDFGFAGAANQIRLVEGIRIPSGANAKDGLQAIVVPGAGLYVREYKRDHHPYARMVCEPEPVGFHGTSIADELCGIQLEIDETLTKIREGHETGGHVLLIVQPGSKVNKAKLTNILHSIVECDGTVQPVIVPAVAPEVYQWVWTLVDRAYQIWGTSQLSASAQIPQGLQASGRAMRVYHDVETERFSYLARAWEQFLLDICDRIIDAAEDLSKEDAQFSVRYRSNEGIRKIKWSDVSLARDAYVLQIQPKSYLDESGPGRVAGVQDMVDLQTIDPRAVPSLMRDPDLRGFPDAYSAGLKMARKQCDDILQHGKSIIAEGYQDLTLALDVGLEALQRAETYSDVDQTNLQLLRDYVNDLVERTKPPPPPPMPPMPSVDPMAPPMGAPMPAVDPTMMPGVPQ